MAKLTRIFQNLFGSTGDQSHFGQFGSQAAGSPFKTKDPNSIQSLSAFTTNGWLDAINGSNKAPFLEDMNGLFYLLFYQVAYGMQEGIPEWNTATTYYTGSIVKKTGTFELYGSVVDSNAGNALPSKATNGFWQYLNPPSVSPGIISAFGGSVAPFGYLLCDGTAYAQASYPDLYAAVGSTWNTFAGAAAPSAGQFRVPDLRGRTMIGSGTGTSLTARTLAQAIGEEDHLLTTTEMPTHTHQTGCAPGSSFGTTIGSQNTAASVYSPTESTGGGASHNNMQPSAVITAIIKY